MKPLLSFSILLLFASCNQSGGPVRQMQSQIDSLKNKPDQSYKPGLGEFMSGIQIHHAKLWFAGINSNWKLADFEINEIQEAIGDIQQFNADRSEVKSIVMIKAPIDSISIAIKEQNLPLFKKHFIFLTNTCNNCHQVTAHGFNVIMIPTSPPVSNQQFKPAP